MLTGEQIHKPAAPRKLTHAGAANKFSRRWFYKGMDHKMYLVPGMRCFNHGFGSRDRGRRRASRGHDALLPPATTSGFDLLVIKVAVLKGTSGASPSGDGLGQARRSGEQEVGRGS